MKTFLDWSAYDTYGIGDAYSGIPATGGNYAKAVAVCMHSRDCQKTAKGVMCPSFRVTGEAKHSTEARVAAFKAALNEGAGAEAFADPRLDEAMDLCVSCKACKKECPSAVDMTLIKTEYLAQRHEIRPPSLRLRLFGGAPEWLSRYKTLLRLAIKAHNRLPALAKLVERWIGVTARRPMPEPAAKPFVAPAPERGAAERGSVILFVDTFCQHFEPEIAEAAIAVLEHAGYARARRASRADDAEPDRPLCCGRTYLTTGLVEKARREAKRVLAAFEDEIAAKTPIIGLEPSCLLSLRDELYSLGLGPQVGELGKQLYLLEEFLAREHQNKGLRMKLKPLEASAASGARPLPSKGVRRDEGDAQGARLDSRLLLRGRRDELLRHGRQLRARGRALRDLDADGGAVAASRRARRAAGAAHRQRLLLPPSDRAWRGKTGAAYRAGAQRRAGAGRPSPAHCRHGGPQASPSSRRFVGARVPVTGAASRAFLRKDR